MMPVLTTGSLRPFLGPDFDRMFRSFFSEHPFGSSSSAMPAVNIWEGDTAYVVEAEVPGYTLEDLEVSVLTNRLVMKGTREETCEGASYRRRERRGGSFERELALPDGLDADGVAARLTNGVLVVTLPKAKAVLPRRIAVQNQ
jgi:HSP20 family protein